MDLNSPVADAYYDRAPFEFQGTLKQLHFTNLEADSAALSVVPDD